MKLLARISAVLLVMVTTASYAGDADDLTTMLREFLAGVNEEAIHDAFWADDLIYTSSRGTRTNKAEIMSGFSSADEDEGEGGAPVPGYSAEDIQVQVYGNTAIVAFRLVAAPAADAADDTVTTHYLNTGTFLKRNGNWQVVAWQATIAED